jgi:hypothetical protein
LRAASLSSATFPVVLNGLTTVTDQQAESVIKIGYGVSAGNLTDKAAAVRIEAASLLAETSDQYREPALKILTGDTALDDWWSALRACRAIELLSLQLIPSIPLQHLG